MAVTHRKKRFLLFTLTLFSLSLLPLHPASGAPPVSGKIKAHEVAHAQPSRTGTRTQETGAPPAALSTQALTPKIPLETLLSPVTDAQQLFDHVGLHVIAAPGVEELLTFEIRSSADGKTWSPWQELVEDDDLREPSRNELYFPPRVVPTSRYAQYRVWGTPQTLAGITDLKLTFLDVSDLNLSHAQRLLNDLTFGFSQMFGAVQAATPTRIYTRADWAADETLMHWTPEYAPWKKAIVHHTVTSNSYSSAPSEIRSIYYFHAVTRGWGDIGYNFLVDKYGNVWQGRQGGDDVIGGQAYGWNSGTLGVASLGDFSTVPPPDSLLTGLANILALTLAQRGVQPIGADSFTHYEESSVGAGDWRPVVSSPPNIIGHRDANYVVGGAGQTACPGDMLYPQLGLIRNRAQTLATVGFTSLLRYDLSALPHEIGSGRAFNSTVTLSNQGTAPISASRYKLVYRLYDRSGQLAAGPLGNYPLPADVPVRGSVAIKVSGISPANDGEFIWRWDLLASDGLFSQTAPTLDGARWLRVNSYDITWGAIVIPSRTDPERTASASATFTNSGGALWPAAHVAFGYHLFDQSGTLLEEGAHTPLVSDVAPGSTITVPFTLATPYAVGTYNVVLDLVWEGGFWFADRGVIPAKRAFRVDYDLRATAYPGTPTGSVYLPNITRTLGGATGWTTPFITQNVGTSSTDLEILYYDFASGSLQARRVISALQPGTSFADIPLHDGYLRDDTQYSVVINSFGAAVVAVVNQVRTGAGGQQSGAYSGSSHGSTLVYLPNVTREFYGYDTPVIVQNVSAQNANVVASFISFDQKQNATLALHILPGRSAVIDPNYTAALLPGTQYALTLRSDQPIQAVLNGANQDIGPLAFSHTGLDTGYPTLYAAYVVKSSGSGVSSPVVLQNLGTTATRATLTFTPLGGGPNQTLQSPSINPGSSWAYDPRFTLGTVTPCAQPAGTCLGAGEYSLRVDAPGGLLAAIVLPQNSQTAFAYSAAPGNALASARLYFPNLTRNLGGQLGWNTSVYLQSQGATTATLAWYRFSDGKLITTQTITLPRDASGKGSGAVRIDPRTIPMLADDGQYALVVKGSDGPVSGMVVESNGQGGDSQMAYEGFLLP